MRPLRLAFFLSPLAALGCVSLTPPSVDVIEFKQAAASPDGRRFEVTLEVSNPSSVPLPLPEASYRLRVAGLGEYAYIDLPNAVVGALQTQRLTLPAAISAGQGELTGETWELSGSLVYEPDRPLRKFLTETGSPLPRVFFSGEGSLAP